MLDMAAVRRHLQILQGALRVEFRTLDAQGAIDACDEAISSIGDAIDSLADAAFFHAQHAEQMSFFERRRPEYARYP